jgi:uncharacterized phage-like protein YoqJ
LENNRLFFLNHQKREKGIMWEAQRERSVIFIGQEDCGKLSKNAVFRQLEILIHSGYRHFLSGGIGSFDRICTQCSYHLKIKYPHLRISLMVPYLDYEVTDPVYFDFILFPDKLKPLGKNSDLLERRLFLIEQAAAVLCYGDEKSTELLPLYQAARVHQLPLFPITAV